MNRNLFIAMILGMAFLLNAAAKAEDDMLKMPFNVGVYGGLNFNMHTPSFQINDRSASIVDPIMFNANKMSLGPAFGIIGNYPLSDLFTISGRIGYNGMNAKFEQALSNSTHTFEATLGYLEITPVLQAHNLIAPVRNLYFMGGFEFGIPIYKDFIQTETMKSPATLKTFNGTIPNTNIRIALALGVGYVYKITDKVFLTPEASFRFPFTNVSSDIQFSTWNVPQFRLGVALTFSFESILPGGSSKREPGEEMKAGFREIRYYDNEGRHFPLQTVRVEDVQYTELFPFIPYVFCGLNSPEPPENNQALSYKSEKGEFTVQKLEPDALKINKSTLDIIGTRMKENTSMELTITGTNDNKKEAKSAKIALQRAEWAKKYLVDNYQINPDRINVRATGLPDKPSASTVADGVEENRRIEFSSSNPKLFEPIIIENENQRIADPNLIEFIPYVETNDSIKSWRMEITQADKILRRNNGAGVPPPMQWAIHPNELVNKQIPIDYMLTAETEGGMKKDAHGTIPVEYFSTSRKKTEDLPDKVISKFSLILFDFDKSEISSGDMEIIDKHIVPAIKFNSTVKIYGYTDRIGDEAYNKNLANRRAESVKAELEKRIKSAKFEVYGVGESNVLFDNDNPIGRQLSRTVQVHVITPK